VFQGKLISSQKKNKKKSWEVICVFSGFWLKSGAMCKKVAESGREIIFTSYF